MESFDGENLSKVFTELKIELGRTNPNVIRAWFDTDDIKLKKMLNWICVSISNDNFLTVQESSEFNKLESPYSDIRLEKELESIKEDYPNIFDKNIDLDIELLQDELELLQEQEHETDELIKKEEKQQERISELLSKVTSKQIKASLKYKEAQEKCLGLGTKLDDLNTELYQKLERYCINLNNFEFAHVSNFMNNLDTSVYEENVENMSVYLNTVVEGSLTNIMDDSNLDYDSSFALKEDNLNKMKNRIHLGYQNYLAQKIEEEQKAALNKFLLSCSPDYMLDFAEDVFLQVNIESKREHYKLICGILDSMVNKFSNQFIVQPKLRIVKDKLNKYQSKLDILSKSTNCMQKIFTFSNILKLLLAEEKKDIDGTDKLFKKILSYTTKDLQSCVYRTEKMTEIINEMKLYQSKPVEEKYKLIKDVVNLLNNNNLVSLNDAFQIFTEFKDDLHALEKQLFVQDNITYQNRAKEISDNIDILQRFLIGGPTNRIVTIPFNLHLMFHELDKHLNSQVSSVQLGVKTMANMRNISSNKWKHYRNQLWMFFLKDPERMMSIIQEIEQFKKDDHQPLHPPDITLVSNFGSRLNLTQMM